MKDKDLTQEGMNKAFIKFLESIPIGIGYNQAIENCFNYQKVKRHKNIMVTLDRMKKSPDQ